jgi:hypothetical protein
MLALDTVLNVDRMLLGNCHELILVGTQGVNKGSQEITLVLLEIQKGSRWLNFKQFHPFQDFNLLV